MTPEMQFAKALGYSPSEEEKLASSMSSLSVEELEALLLQEWGSEKEAGFFTRKAGETAKNVAKEAVKSGVKETGSKVLETVKKHAPTAVAAGVGAATANKLTSKKETKTASISVEEFKEILKEKADSRTKFASAEWADRVGRSLARTDFEKQALNWGSAVGAVKNFAGQAASKAAPAMAAAKNFAGQAATKAQPYVGRAANAVLGSSNGKNALIGAGVGAAAGALKDPGMDSKGKPKSRLTGALVGGALGAGAGAAAKPVLQRAGGANTRFGNYMQNASAQAMKGPALKRPMLPSGA